MKTHRTDLVALLFGLAILITGAAFLPYELTDTNIDAGWFAALGFVLVGLVALVVTLTGGARSDRDDRDDELDEPDDEPEAALAVEGGEQ
jgi:uncharacterized membrane protein